MIRSIPTMFLTLGLVAFICSAACRDPSGHILHRDRPARWGDYAALLARDVGQLRYLGGVQVALGGCDVFAAESGDWWLVGPGRRFRKCTPETALAVSDAVMNEAIDAFVAEE